MDRKVFTEIPITEQNCIAIYCLYEWKSLRSPWLLGALECKADFREAVENKFMSHEISVSIISWIWISATYYQTTPLVQWLRIHLPVQGTWVWSLVGRIPHATTALHHDYGVCALEPVSHNCWAQAPKACAPQVKPPQWKPRAPQLESNPLLTTTRESLPTVTKIQCSQKKFFKTLKYIRRGLVLGHAVKSSLSHSLSAFSL